MSEVVEHVRVRFQAQAEAAGVILETPTYVSDFPEVKGDEARLTQALGELVENAIVFTPRGGRVVLSLAVTQELGRGWVTVAVRDTGPGIPAEERDKVFDRFFRGSLVESGNIPGTGLGLSIAEAIARAHNGQVTLDTGQEGSTFTLRIPLAEG
jgi:signal transduction histidine kinase